MTQYIHNLEGWPQFRWGHDKLASRLAAVRHHQGRLIGRMEGLGFQLRAEAVLQTLTEETLKSTENADITGEDWKPYEASTPPAATVARQSAAIEIAAFQAA